MPTKIASRKKAKPSSTNGKPYTSPNGAIRPGQRMPISNDSSVPDTAPAANSTPIALAQVWARSRSIGLPRLWARHSVNTTIVGNAIPKHENTMCQPSDSAICIRAGNRFSAAPASTSAWSTRPAWSGRGRRRSSSRPAEPACLT